MHKSKGSILSRNHRRITKYNTPGGTWNFIAIPEVKQCNQPARMLRRIRRGGKRNRRLLARAEMIGRSHV